ncbi:MAG: glycerate kinase, partial [Clostridia bacterium]|nr:glycerate kinase [Clostridia bacterium]
PSAIIKKIPVADGGEGTVDCFENITGGKRVKCEVTGPNFQKVAAEFLLCGNTAVIESAQANGLPLADPKSAADTTTYGVGELISAAAEQGAEKFIIGIGGSATNDCGCGMAAALGTKFFDKDGREFIPVGATLSDIESISFGKRYDITVLCDVTNPLYGENGAAYVYAPQKGADEEQVKMLDDGLRHTAGVLKRYDIDIAGMKGAGAAGGMGAGLVAFCGAKLKRGIEVVLDLAGFEKSAEEADFIITGEGSLDSQSFSGKVIDGVISRSAGKPVIAVAGISKLDDYRGYGLSAVFETNEKHLPFEEIILTAEDDLRKCCKKVAEYIKNYE